MMNPSQVVCLCPNVVPEGDTLGDVAWARDIGFEIGILPKPCGFGTRDYDRR